MKIAFGAGGSTTEKTSETVSELRNLSGSEVAPHLSCICQTQLQIKKLLNHYKKNDVKRLVALRGDYPSGITRTGDFRFANELVEFIRQETGPHFQICVAAYPEFHPECQNVAHDLENLKRKVDAGANLAITQYFFNIDAYRFFCDACEKAGIDIPIIPGIMPIGQFEGLVRFSKRCGAEIPSWLYQRLEHLNQF